LTARFALFRDARFRHSEARVSPRIVEAITEGRQPPEITVIALSRRLELPLLWSAQEEMLCGPRGFTPLS